MVGEPEPWTFGLPMVPGFADGIIAVSLLLIAAAVFYLYRRGAERDRREGWLIGLFIVCIVAIALVHFASALSLFAPAQGLVNLLKVAAALIALITAIVMWRRAPRLMRPLSRDRVQTGSAAHLQTLEELKHARQQLEGRVSERKSNEDHLRLLLQELTHRSKNLLAVIQAIARQTASRTRSVDDFLDRFSARLYAIGSSHDLLIADDWHGASLRMLVEQQLEAHTEDFGGRIAIDGEDVMLKPEAVHNLGLALHELTANAEKYGSLSDPRGKVRIQWNFCEANLKLIWQEQGGPAVSPPERSGFGRAMIENVVGKALEGDVTLSFPAKGVRCEIVIPVAQVTSRG
jgi:two-component sensor histidine kinase